MKTTKLILFSLAALVTAGWTAPDAAAQEEAANQMPNWVKPHVERVSTAVPGLTDDQKLKISDAIQARGKAVKEAKDSGGTPEEIKAAEQEAWSTYVRTMKTILTKEQFAKFEEWRKKGS